MEGWIKLHRQIIESEFYFAERFTRAQAWIDLLLLANHTNKTIFIRGVQVNLNRGELGYAITTLASRWSWNERTVNKYLEMLSKREMIQYKKTNVTTIITINNYDLYQDSTEQSTEQNTEQSKSRVQTDKNDKNVKNGKNINIPTFDEFFSYAKTLKIYNESMDFQIKAKYESWKENKWKDGYGKKIKNWKTKLMNTIPHFNNGADNGKNNRQSIGSFKSRLEYKPDPEKFNHRKKELREMGFVD